MQSNPNTKINNKRNTLAELGKTLPNEECNTWGSEYTITAAERKALDQCETDLQAAEILGPDRTAYLRKQEEENQAEASRGYPCECGCGCKKRVYGNSTYCSACAAGCCGEW